MNEDEREKSIEEMQRENETLALLHNYGLTVAAVPFSENIFSVVAATLCDKFAAGAVAISLYDENASELICKYSTLADCENAAAQVSFENALQGTRTTIVPEVLNTVIGGVSGNLASLLTDENFFRSQMLPAQALFHVGWFTDVVMQLNGAFIGVILVIGKSESGQPDFELLKRYGAVTAPVLRRWLVEQKVVAENAKYRFMAEHMKDALWQMTPDMKFTYINPCGEQMLGYPPDVLLGRSLLDFATPSSLLYLQQVGIILQQKLLRGERLESEVHEVELLRKDGSVVWTEVVTNPVYDDGGVLKGFQGVTRDSTDRKLTEIALKESEERLRLALAAGNQGLFDLSFETGDLIVSPEYGRMLGYAAGEFHPNFAEWLDELHADDRLIVSRVFEEYGVGSRTNQAVEFRLRTKSGDWKWILSLGKIVERDARSNPKRFVGTHTDITERKKAKEALLRTQFAVDQARDVVHWVGPNAELVYVNEAACRSLGYTREELLSMSVFDIDPQFPKERWKEHWEKTRLLGNSMIETVHKAKDGRTFPVEIAINFMRYGGKEYHCASARDITERKLAEKAIRESDQKFRTVVQNADAIIFILDTNGIFRLSEGQALARIGLVPGQVVGVSALEMYKDNSSVVDGIRKALSGEQARVINVIQDIIFETTYTPYYDSEGNIIGVVGMALDITERKVNVEKLRQSEEQFRLISENVADLIAVVDLEGRRVYSSPSYNNILGGTSSLTGSDSFKEIHPDDRQRIKALFAETIRTGVGQRADSRFVTQSGAIRHIESQGSVIRDQQGNIFNVVIVSRDVTEKKTLEQQFLRAQRLESLGTLAGGVAHDLNNVLSPILLAIASLKNQSLDERGKRTLTTLESSVLRGRDIVKQILAFARGVEGERASIQIKHLVKETVSMMRETFPRAISGRSIIGKDSWSVPGDATQIHQLLMNLCVNARDAMPSGGTITLSLENTVIDEQYARMNIEARPGRYVMLAVEDTGTGMPPEVLDRVFEPFFTTKDVGKGTGLGLSTVHTIVKSHGGFVTVYSEPDKGTTFRVYLPAAEGIAERASLAESHQILPGRGELILVVDDEASICQITKQTLEAFGYRVITAADGTEALALYALHREEIALVLTDMMMPIMDGPRTIRALRKLSPTAKIIACSGLQGNAYGATSSEVAVDAFIAKPYTAEKLLNAIHRVLHDEVGGVPASCRET